MAQTSLLLTSIIIFSTFGRATRDGCGLRLRDYCAESEHAI
jgi:hypothetical protein